MPGIVGLITRGGREQAEAQLRRMVQTLCHEEFYETGTWTDEAAGVYVGWVARQGSFADGMPLRNEQGSMTLIYSGEDFPDPGLHGRLKQQGHVYDNRGPEYLVHLAEECKDFPRSLNGRFHGILLDGARGTSTLFNDRYGMHRIYYHEGPDSFYFAAEAKAILAVRPALRSLDPRSMAEFISCGCALENRTLFRGIQMLPPASAWVFRNGQPEQKQSYFSPREWEEQHVLDPEVYYSQLREVFSRNLSRYFVTPEKLGISLTGGLDSRMIMAWRDAAPGTLPCYSFGGPYRDCQDVIVARKVAALCGQQHQVIPVGREFLSQFPHLAERTVFLTDGCVEVKHSADLYVNQIAARIAPVRMTGNYGGEVLRRVRAFKPVRPVPDLYVSELKPHLEAAGQNYAGLLQGHPLSFAVFRQAPWHHYGLLSLEQSQLSLRSPYLDNEFVEAVYRAPQASLTNDDVSLRLIREGSPALGRLRTDRGFGGSLPRSLAVARRKWLEFTFKAEYAWDYGMPQSVARVDHALRAAHLEHLFLGRHKFYHYRIWYKNALANYVREMLLDSRSLSRPYLQRNIVEQIVKGHLTGGRNYTAAIHKLLTLELVHRLFVDSI